MTVKELFELANFKTIAKQLADEDYDLNHDNTKSIEEKEQIKIDICNYILECYQEMMQIEPDNLKENLIFCSFVRDLEDDEDSYINVSCIYKKDLFEKEIPFCDTQDKANNLSMKEWEEKYIQTYAFEFTPWKEVLGYEVPKTNINAYGLDKVAKAIYDEMTFFGYKQENAESNAEEEKNILLERVKDVEEHPENCVPIEHVFEDLYTSFGITPPTEEEKEQQRILWQEEMRINQLESKRILTKIKEEYLQLGKF